MSPSPEHNGVVQNGFKYDPVRAEQFIQYVADQLGVDVPYTGDPSPVVDALLEPVLSSAVSAKTQATRDAPRILTEMLQLPSSLEPSGQRREMHRILEAQNQNMGVGPQGARALDSRLKYFTSTTIPRIAELAASSVQRIWERPSPNEAKKGLKETVQQLAHTLDDIDAARQADSPNNNGALVADLKYIFGMRRYSGDRQKHYSERERAAIARSHVATLLRDNKANLAAGNNPLYYIFGREHLDTYFDDGVQAYAKARNQEDTIGKLLACNDMLSATNTVLLELFS
jgi:hypothetical protein